MDADSPLGRPEGFQGEFREDIEARAVYSEAAGIGRAIPRAVAVARDADDVVTLVRWAHRYSLSLIPRGSGTSMAGGAIGSGIIVDLSELSTIGPVDPIARRVSTGSGALRSDVNSAAAKHGLRFPVDPSSGDFCTVGGMAATNAAGAHSLLFGSTRRWVVALDYVFADGSRARVARGEPAPVDIPAVKRFADQARPRIREAVSHRAHLAHPGVRKDSSGYALREYAKSDELIDLLVGSEGTLAVIVGLELKLTELPGATSGVLGAFSSLENAVAGSGKARELGAAACELLDRTFLEIAGGATPSVSDSARLDAARVDSIPSEPGLGLSSLPRDTEAVLLAEVEGDSAESAARLAEEIAAAFRDSEATTVTLAFSPGEQHEIWELRHAASPILSRLDPALKSMQFIEDGAVPPDRLAEYVLGVREALDRHRVKGVIFGHAGDAHVHVNPLIDVSAPDWRVKIEGLLDDVVALTRRLGGTLSGEHGDGSLRAPLLPEVWPAEEVDLFAVVKYCFDPAGILNPGVKVPLDGQRAISDVKYDPALETLPGKARAALDFVSAERAYAKPRLSLIDRAG